jgi:hypothetical protein
MLMRSMLRRSRGLVVAIAALALTATAAFAARPATAPPAAAADGLSKAAAVSGQTVPVSGADNAPQAEASSAPESEAPETEAPTTTTDAAPPADTHGALVSAAAQAATPDGIANHGAYVSSIAKANHGQTTAAAATAAAAAAKEAHKPAH